jgi:hypothetical protein
MGIYLTGCGGGAAITAQPAPAKEPLAELRILVIGQSISANCNEHQYGASVNVFQVAKDGAIKPAADPFEWADCGGGSMWMPLGKRLIDDGIAKKVVFMPIGVGGTKVRDWQEGGSAFAKLNDAITVIKKQGLTFDFAFWHQGSADIGTPKAEYQTRLSSVVSYVGNNVPIQRWLIALHSRCFGNYDPNIEDVQRIFGNAPELKRFPGPNNNLLGEEYRIADRCHLNQKGQEQMAGMWLEAVLAAQGSN